MDFLGHKIDRTKNIVPLPAWKRPDKPAGFWIDAAKEVAPKNKVRGIHKEKDMSTILSFSLLHEGMQHTIIKAALLRGIGLGGYWASL